ncbi:Ig-like domain-containing protein [Pseudomonas putida]|uniref:Ig-like domain-containing protein n=1 Tax=Pseudomonas putida TaxID=303 RepID=UPI0023655ED5|nr:Ig-like domain-containing protein [Pseudomonas putida]MDD2049745.1 hypothetical protein [Pseudomonas putida]
MSTPSESHPDSLVTQTIAGLSNLILDPDEVRNGTHANIPQYAGKAEGDVITLTWQGGSGATFSTSVTVDEGNAKVPIPLRIAYQPYIIDNLDNTVSVIYEVKRNNGRTATAKALSFLIKRQLVENLLAPTVLEASGNVLEPVNALNGATVLVIYQGMRKGDHVTVYCNGEKVQPGKPVGAGEHFVAFTIPVSVVAANLGKTISVDYEVVRGSNPGVQSRSRSLVVGELPAGALQPPVVPQASGERLDLGKFQGDATVTVKPWLLIAEGQRYWIEVSGTLHSGAPYSFYAAQNQSVSASEVGTGLSRNVLRSELQQLAHNSALTVQVQVAFAGAVDRLQSSQSTFVLLAKPLDIGAAHAQTVNASYIIAVDRPPLRPAASSGGSYQRQATGGVPPYAYQSSNLQVATVDQTGFVVAGANGASVITVFDANGDQASYTVTFSGVRLVQKKDDRWWTVPDSEVRPEGRALSRVQMGQFWEQYKNEDQSKSVPAILNWPLTYYWSGDNITSNDHARAVDLQNLAPNFEGISFQGGNRFPALYRIGW